jgi:uncharacterized membrane protein
MIPNPLHPALVHFPIVLMIFLPVLAVGALWAIRRGARPLLAWSVPVAGAVLLVLSAAASLKTGQSQEEQVEDRVPESVIEPHEEAAEQFLAGSGLVLIVMAIGLAGNRAGRAARLVGTAAALALVIAGYRVGHTGGQIVYGTPGQPGLMAPASGMSESEDD